MRILKRREAALGRNHPATLQKVAELALALEGKGQLEGLAQLWTRAHVGRSCALGEQHPATLSAATNRAHFLEQEGDTRQAEQLYRDTAARSLAARGSHHEGTTRHQSNLALFLENTREQPTSRAAPLDCPSGPSRDAG